MAPKLKSRVSDALEAWQSLSDLYIYISMVIYFAVDVLCLCNLPFGDTLPIRP